MKEVEKQLREARKISIKEGSAYGVSEGFGLKYITPYALSLGATNAHIGFLTSLPSLLGNLSKLYTLKLMWKLSRRKIAYYGALFQAIMWLFIILIGVLFFIFKLNSNITPTLLIFIYSLLVVFGASYGPAWNSWMRDIISKDSGKYFGKRNRIITTIILISMIIGSFILDYFKKTNIFMGFAIIFFIAFISRTISARFFLKKYEPEFKPEKEYHFSFMQFIKKMFKNNFGKFVIFISLMQFATAIASPFFAVYMLKQLNFSYITYTLITISPIISSLIFMPAWGKFADSYGNIKVIKICSFIIPAIPMLWVLSPLFLKYTPMLLIPYLLIIEFITGIAWSGFNLSAGNFAYDAVTRQRMAICVSYFNIIESMGIFVGAILGGIIASLSFSFLTLTPIMFIFLLSGITRFIVAIYMVKRIKEVREVKNIGMKEAKEKVLMLTPQQTLEYFEINIPKK